MWMVFVVALMLGTIRCFRKLGTVFAPGVRRDLFDERLIGMTEEEVLAVHGPPLKSYRGSNGDEYWYYSKHVSSPSSFYWRLELSINEKTRRVDWYFHHFYGD